MVVQVWLASLPAPAGVTGFNLGKCVSRENQKEQARKSSCLPDYSNNKSTGILVSGLNGFLNFLNMGPMPSGLAGQLIGAIALSNYSWVVAELQVAGGALLLVNRFVPLGLVRYAGLALNSALS